MIGASFLFGDEPKSTIIPINQAARHVIIAHCLLESKLEEGAPVGEHVADYIFRLSSVGPAEGEFRVPIRERFEIALAGGQSTIWRGGRHSRLDDATL